MASPRLCGPWCLCVKLFVPPLMTGSHAGAQPGHRTGVGPRAGSCVSSSGASSSSRDQDSRGSARACRVRADRGDRLGGLHRAPRLSPPRDDPRVCHASGGIPRAPPGPDRWGGPRREGIMSNMARRPRTHPTAGPQGGPMTSAESGPRLVRVGSAIGRGTFSARDAPGTAR
jgi:hypothetical protein